MVRKLLLALRTFRHNRSIRTANWAFSFPMQVYCTPSRRRSNRIGEIHKASSNCDTIYIKMEDFRGYRDCYFYGGGRERGRGRAGHFSRACGFFPASTDHFCTGRKVYFEKREVSPFQYIDFYLWGDD